MTTTYFFTDADYLPAQGSSDAFGSSSSTEFQLRSGFTGLDSAASALPAYAVCKGSALIQEVDGHTDLVNLVVRPEVQPNPLCGPVAYFVYRGLKKEHFLGADDEVVDESSSVTDLMVRMWGARNQLNADKAALDTSYVDESLTRGDLGLHELADTALDGSTSLDEVFETYVFQPIHTGDYIGEFDTTSTYGFEILLDHKSYRHTLGDVRELDHVLTLTFEPDQTEFPAPEDITTRHRRDQILGYADPAAWYGMLAQDQVTVYRSGFTEKLSGDDLYDSVLTKFHTADKIYVDIRSELNDSLNYFDEYGEGIAEVRTRDSADAVVTREYHDGNGWPLLVLDSSQFPATTEAKNKLVVSLPKGDSDTPMLVLARAALHENYPERKERYVLLNFDGSADWTQEVSIGLQNHVTLSTVYPSMVQLHLSKRIDTTATASSSTERPQKNSPFDNILSPGSLHLPDASDRVVWRTLPEPVYVGWTSLDGADFIARSGVARAPIGEVAFFYRDGSVEENGVVAPLRAGADLPLAGGESTSASFLQALESDLNLVVLEFVERTTSTGSTLTLLELNAVHDYLTSDPFKQSADDLIVVGYTQSESEAIATAGAALWTGAAPHYAISDISEEIDTGGLPYFAAKLSITRLEYDEGTHSHAIETLDTGLSLYSVDGLRYFTEQYAVDLKTMTS